MREGVIVDVSGDVAIYFVDTIEPIPDFKVSDKSTANLLDLVYWKTKHHIEDKMKTLILEHAEMKRELKRMKGED